MIKEVTLCTECVQQITNPICPACSSRHIEEWTKDKKLSKKEFSEVKKNLKKIINESEETPSNIQCVICGGEKVNLCTYCFTEKSKKAIDSGIKRESIREDFREDFDSTIWTI